MLTTTNLLSLMVEAGLMGWRLIGPSPRELSALEPGTLEEFPHTVIPLCSCGLLGADPTEFLALLLWESGSMRRETKDLGKLSFASSSGEDIKLGLNSTTGTLEKCSVGILICGKWLNSLNKL